MLRFSPRCSRRSQSSDEDMSNRPWKARIFAAASLDGFIARKNGDILWLTQPKPNPEHTPPSSPKQTPTFEQHMSDVDFIVMGRETYEVCLSFAEWPYPISKSLLVLSTTLQSPASDGPQRSRVVSSLEEVEKILAEEGRRCYMWMEGRQFRSS